MSEQKLNEGIEGATAFRVGTSNDGRAIIIDFTTPTAWIGLPPDVARQLAMDLLERAYSMDGVLVQPEGRPIAH